MIRLEEKHEKMLDEGKYMEVYEEVCAMYPKLFVRQLQRGKEDEFVRRYIPKVHRNVIRNFFPYLLPHGKYPSMYKRYVMMLESDPEFKSAEEKEEKERLRSIEEEEVSMEEVLDNYEEELEKEERRAAGYAVIEEYEFFTDID